MIFCYMYIHSKMERHKCDGFMSSMRDSVITVCACLQGILYKKSSKPLSKEWKKKYVTLLEDGRLTYHPSLHVCHLIYTVLSKATWCCINTLFSGQLQYFNSGHIYFDICVSALTYGNGEGHPA